MIDTPSGVPGYPNLAGELDAINERLSTIEGTESIPVQSVLLSGESAPERYIRINITKNTKGYQYETTVSVTWSDLDGTRELQDLLRESDRIARDEIARREYTDIEGPAGSDDRPF